MKFWDGMTDKTEIKKTDFLMISDEDTDEPQRGSVEQLFDFKNGLDETITGQKTFAVSPKVPEPIENDDAMSLLFFKKNEKTISKTVYTSNSILNSFFKEIYVDLHNSTVAVEKLYCTRIHRNASGVAYAIVLRLNDVNGDEVCGYYSDSISTETRDVVQMWAVNGSGISAYAVVDWSVFSNVSANIFNDGILSELCYSLKFSPFIKGYKENIYAQMSENKNKLFDAENSIIMINSSVKNKLLNSGEIGFPENFISMYAGDGWKSLELISTPNDSPFNKHVLKYIIKHTWLNCYEDKKFEFQIENIRGTTGLTFSFWVCKSQLDSINCNSLDYYSGQWNNIAIPENESEESTSLMWGAKLKLVKIFGDYRMLQFKLNEDATIFMLRFSTAAPNGTLYISNVIALDNYYSEVGYATIAFKNKKQGLMSYVDDLLVKNEDSRIICWGDSLTAGDGVGVYPIELQALLGSDYVVVNQGVGGENVPTILGRLGSEPMYAPISYTLPTNLDPVLIADGTIGSYLCNSYNNQQDCFPLLQEGSSRVNPCYVAGVECELYRETISGGSPTEPTQNRWYIKRTAYGNAINISVGEPIVMQASKNYRNPRAAILWIGTNGGFYDSSDLVNRLINAKEYINTNNVIIINRHTIVDTTTDNLLLKNFGCRFFNWRRYVSTIALQKNGITPTTNETLTSLQIANGVKSDIQCMIEGVLPSSLWRRAYRSASDQLNDTGVTEDSKDSTHMNKKGYQILAQEIKNLLINLGIVNYD